MRRPTTIRLVALAAIALAAFFLLRSSRSAKPVSSKECIGECCQKKKNAPDDNGLIWESFSRQFISVSN